jgi:hypothetical protein
MTAEAATLAGRAAAEQLMVDTCTISEAGGQGVFNETTGQYDGATSSTVYSGPCRVKPRDNQDRIRQFGEQTISLWPYLVSVPMSVTGIDVDALVTITTSELDPDLAGKVLRVRQVAQGSHITARRLGCELNAG